MLNSLGFDVEPPLARPVAHGRRPVAGRTLNRCLPGVLALGLAFMHGASSQAAGPRLLARGEVPQDRRLEPLKDYDGYFPFTPPATKEAWLARAERVRRQLLVAAGLWPMPTPTPPSAVVHGRVERPGYTVERVYFESYPGFYVTGSLFRPTGKTGRLPGVLCPHGHLAEARFADSGLKDVRNQIALGAERFEVGGRYREQARAVQLARMGCVVLSYDMVGYCDSQQISHELAHRFAKQRPDFDTPEHWGYFSTQAELRAQGIFGLQTYNSLRALDWLLSLPDVDPARIGVTGSSGGGTQTFILAALDPRVTVAVPVVMVSTAMQGGCTCENASLLRVDTGNIELAALVAPRTLGLVGADDWTKEIMTKGLPELKKIYELFGAKDRVMAKALTQFPHNYNYVSREVMYQWFNERLGLGLESPVIEEDFQPLSREELTVWDADHPRPPGGPDFERQLLERVTADAERQMTELTPRDEKSLARFREVAGGAVDVIVGRGLPAAGAIDWDMLGENDRGDWLEFSGWLRDKAHGEALPTVFLHPYTWNHQAVLWLTTAGKAGLFQSDGSPQPAVARLLKAGTTVVGVDLFEQGEFLPDGQPPSEARKVTNPREFAGYTLGYNSALVAQRAHDVLAAISFCRNYAADRPERISLVAIDGSAPWAAAALAQAGGGVDRVALDTAGFRFSGLRSTRDVNMLPAVVKYGDLPALLALAAPTPLWLAGEGAESPPLVKAAYGAAGAGERVECYKGPRERENELIVDWLLK